MHKHVENKKNLIYRKLLLTFSSIWIVASIFILVHTNVTGKVLGLLFGVGYCQSCTSTSLIAIIFPTLIFFIGGLGIGYSRINIIQGKLSSIQAVKQAAPIALAISIACLVIYYWVNLSTNGL